MLLRVTYRASLSGNPRAHALNKTCSLRVTCRTSLPGSPGADALSSNVLVRVTHRTTLLRSTRATAFARDLPRHRTTLGHPRAGSQRAALALPCRPPRGGQSQRQALPLLPQARAAPLPALQNSARRHWPLSVLRGLPQHARQQLLPASAPKPLQGEPQRALRDRWPLSTGGGRSPPPRSPKRGRNSNLPRAASACAAAASAGKRAETPARGIATRAPGTAGP